jgi:PleD family two-component response regulator
MREVELIKRIRSSLLNRQIPVVMVADANEVNAIREGFKGGLSAEATQRIETEPAMKDLVDSTSLSYGASNASKSCAMADDRRLK